MTVTVATTSTRGTIAYIASPKRLSLGVTRCVSQCVCVLYVLCVPCGKALASVCVSAVVIKTQQKLNAKLKVVDRQLKKTRTITTTTTTTMALAIAIMSSVLLAKAK